MTKTTGDHYELEFNIDQEYRLVAGNSLKATGVVFTSEGVYLFNEQPGMWQIPDTHTVVCDETEYRLGPLVIEWKHQFDFLVRRQEQLILELEFKKGQVTRINGLMRGLGEAPEPDDIQPVELISTSTDVPTPTEIARIEELELELQKTLRSLTHVLESQLR